ALRASKVTSQCPRAPDVHHEALQLNRSRTSTFANYSYVQSAEARRDFIHKMRICLKELRETRTWLKFASKMRLSSAESISVVLHECDELLAILATSIATARRNGRHVIDH